MYVWQCHLILSVGQTLVTAIEKMLEESVIDSFVQDQIPVNTRKKTENDVKIFLKWMKETTPEENRQLWEMTPSELNTLLRSFYLTVKKKDGGEYEPDTIRGFQNSLDRHLSDHHYAASIIRREQFKSSRDVLQAKRRALKKDGMGRKPHRSEHLTNEDEKEAFGNGSTRFTVLYTDQQILSNNKNGVWYKNQPLGVHSLSEIMKKMASEGGLPGRKTNHSGRKTTAKRLREAEIDNADIIQLTGHKNIQSLNHYSTITEKKQRQMSDILVKTESVEPSTSSTADHNAFSDDFDVETVLKSIENFECPPVATESAPLCNTSESNDFNLTAQNSLGFTAPLFQSANITGGTFNLTLNFNGKGF